jgi:diaminopimelate epimerase
LTKSTRADCCLDLFNSDGTWAEKSGNGLRCVAAYFYSHYSRRKNLTFEINNEIASVKIEKSDKISFMMEVSLGRPVFETDKIPMKSEAKFHINQPIVIEGNKLPVTSLSVGNPHTVMFLDNFEFDWQELGQIIENCEYYPHRTNVEFVKISNRKKVILNDWERGAGATGSSGTGAAAAAVAGVVNGLLDREVEVVFPRGSLFIRWNEEDDTIYLTGPAEFSCEGTFHFIDK